MNPRSDQYGRPILTAQPTQDGFFGLSRLRDFVTAQLEPYVQISAHTPVVLDLSSVRVWDIAAILWLSIALHHYRHDAGLSFKLRLPQGTGDMELRDRQEFDRSAAYLRRWRFDVALTNIIADVDRILVEDQAGYFSPERRAALYTERLQRDQDGLLQRLVSRRLVEIINLTDLLPGGGKGVTKKRVNDTVVRFQEQSIGAILVAQCGIDKRRSDLFAEHLLSEALMNVLEHPNATMALMAISVMGKGGELILAVADNGDAIPETIYDRFKRDHALVDDLKDLPQQSYDRDSIPPVVKARIADYATQEHVTRKTSQEGEEDAGMGLTYIKRDTVGEFAGTLRILTDSMYLKYATNADAPPLREAWPHCWSGNLLRIALRVAPDLPTP